MEDSWKKDLAWILIALLAVFTLQVGLKLALHTDSPLVIVVSESMEPVFYRGDVVLLKGINEDNIDDVHVGDVIVYKRPGYEYPIIHRVREIKVVELGGKAEKCFVTWGDNNWAPDPPYPTPYGTVPCVPAYAVEDKALIVFPKIGLIPLIIREHLGLG
ncbi:signal peptidase I [Thermococcus thioreducens]|uniref:Signal peptidase n=1 Tax=Thermococcus thioreducens TaxID=277988 RepID=A0A0Q2RCX5_9EURY|nr:signal peptidase I [Thermococcus thioreducens]ASJ13401.1 S26 family signal peptidase [Thermococcus thioreducens]KQH81758.1 signal peptidase [Thermococcus thioreducens]SEW23933.1 archaean signal peptidase. Serine peptidase. MEROPS family S26B [Thermococcus thioreducens]